MELLHVKKINTKTKIMKEVKGFKGYDKDLICRKGESNEQQYVVGETYEQENAIACQTGFHFCENPLDIFNYYSPSESRFTEVVGSGEISKENNGSDTKVSSSKIKIGVELSLQNIIESGIKFIFERTTLTKESTNNKEKLQASNSGYRGAASNSGYRGAASNSGVSGAASNSGVSGAASNSGDRGAASNSGDSGAASNSGDRGAASNSGVSGAASNSGVSGAASNSGYRGAASNSGDRGAALSVGAYSSSETNAQESVAIVTGYACKVRGNLGSWIVVTERNDNLEIISIISKRVDGKKVKADVWYKNINGKLIEI